MDGEHLLHENPTLCIDGLNMVQLLGKGQWVYGFNLSIWSQLLS